MSRRGFDPGACGDLMREELFARALEEVDELGPSHSRMILITGCGLRSDVAPSSCWRALRLPPLTGHVCYAAWSARD